MNFFKLKVKQLSLLAWTYLTLVGVLGSTLMIPMAYLDFELRKEYIQEVLCINREKPELSCEGKCFLKMKLDQAQDIPAADRQSASENFQLTFFRGAETQLFYVPASVNETSDFSPHLILDFTSQFAASVFHPPRI